MQAKAIKHILKQTHQTYNLIAGDFSETRSKWWQGFGDLAKYVKAGYKVLDVGCGNGRMAELFLDSKVNYLGLDDSQNLIKIAKDKFKDYKQIEFEVANALDFKVAAKYDLALCIAVLHHIPSHPYQLKALMNIADSLKPGGKLIISTWNLFKWDYFNRYGLSLFNLKNKIKYGVWSFNDFFVPWKKTGPVQARYAHSFTKSELKKLLIQAGFEIEEIYFKNGLKKVSMLAGKNLFAIAVKK